MKKLKRVFNAKWIETSKGLLVIESEFLCPFCKKVKSVKALKKPFLYAENPFDPVMYAAERAGWTIGFVNLVKAETVKKKDLFVMCPECTKVFNPEGPRSKLVEAIAVMQSRKK